MLTICTKLISSTFFFPVNLWCDNKPASDSELCGKKFLPVFLAADAELVAGCSPDMSENTVKYQNKYLCKSNQFRHLALIQMQIYIECSLFDHRMQRQWSVSVNYRSTLNVLLFWKCKIKTLFNSYLQYWGQRRRGRGHCWQCGTAPHLKSVQSERFGK